MKTKYDTVIVGARVAGAATAMLMARAGADVLLVDRASLGSDTLSTLALMRGAIGQLDRWGLLDTVVDAGTPAVTRTVFRYGSSETEIETAPLYAPRRTVLDPIIVSGARSAGVDVHHQTRAVDIGFDIDGRVRSIDLEQDGNLTTVSTDLVVGADGLRSWVARRLGVPVTRRGRAANASIAAYVADTGLPTDAYRWEYRTGLTGGAVPTNDNQHVVFVSMQPDRFHKEVGAGVDKTYHRLLTELDAELAEAVRGGAKIGHVRSWPGHVGQFRKAQGPGWALVGDAGYFKDPGAAHGITDAFRDAQLLAQASSSGDFAGYEHTRDTLSAPLFDALERVVDHSWTMQQLPARLITMSKAMQADLVAFDEIVSGPHPETRALSRL
jgi:flavin-dependent dehydrogenase